MVSDRRFGALFKRGSSARSKLLFILGGIILIAIASAFAAATVQALHIRSVTSSEFNQYVLEHHIGQAEESSDQSGLENDFCVLYLNHPLPQATLQQSVINLLYHYHDLDGGTNLTIVYHVPGTVKTRVIADAVYDQRSQTVVVNIHQGNSTGTLKVHVHWPDSWYGN